MKRKRKHRHDDLTVRVVIVFTLNVILIGALVLEYLYV